jgi:hypothetical protein
MLLVNRNELLIDKIDIRVSAQDNRQWLVATKNRDTWERWQFISAGTPTYAIPYHTNIIVIWTVTNSVCMCNR